MAEAWFLDDYTTLTLETSSGTTDYVAGIQGITVTPSVSIEQLYTADSIKIEEQKQHEFSCDVEINYSIWDPEFIAEWLGGSGSSATSMTDTSDPQKFAFNGTFDSVGGDLTLDMEVTGITFEEPTTLDMSQGEFMETGLSGTGEDITNFSITDNTTV